ncbi:hypothetical protein [Neosynechococcus sphagnicola]|uniref:hypothetical protein n=1 Tax=Neosynechococcus sphagnicola TaxID=1501145 RepID=UPI0030844D1B
MVIPTQYRTQAADEKACDLVGVDDFLKVMGDTPVRRIASDTMTLKPQDLPEKGSTIALLSYKF